MPRHRLEEMIRTLTPALATRRDQVLYTRRGNRPSQTPGTGAPAKLTPDERILATVLHRRKLATQELLGELFGVSKMTISRAVREVSPLLQMHRHQITASTARFRTPADVAIYLTNDGPDQAQ